MPQIEVITRIIASAPTWFDLARDIDFHTQNLSDTGERAIDGVTTGLIGPGESVTWQAKHLGVTQRLTSKITAFDRPHSFQDTMTRGAFKSFRHDHFLAHDNGVTLMRDVIVFASPFGLLGRFADRVFMANYLTRLITTRGLALKNEAETHHPASAN